MFRLLCFALGWSTFGRFNLGPRGGQKTGPIIGLILDTVLDLFGAFNFRSG